MKRYRAKRDRVKYQKCTKLIVEHIGGTLSLFQWEGTDFIVEKDVAVGVKINLGLCCAD
jgi:tRNA U34 5-carboxymethylaminomethyl modifying enzyme MnmG/GidA